MKALERLTIGVLVMTFAVTLPAMAQPPVTVTAADPSAGEQDTVGLIVKVTGKNFGANARTDFFKSGTSDPAGISVRSSRVVSSTEIEATIDISIGAALSLFDIRVTNTNGRSGKGTDLFKVVQKGAANACAVEPLDARFELVGTLNTSVGGSALYHGFGSAMAARRVTLTYDSGSRDVLFVAVARGEATGRVEVFFLDPATGALLDGTAVVPGGPVQPHVTILPNPAAGTSSGGQLAIGDVNGDGLPDLVSQHNGGDRTTLMLAVRQFDGVVQYATVAIPPPTPSLKFGFSAAMGDLTGDGRDEIVLVRPLYQQGKTVLYPRLHVYGAPTGTPLLIASAAAPETQTKTDSFYGVDVAVGDVSGDGLADVLVAVPRWKVGDSAEAGAVFLHSATGGADVLASTPIIISGPSPARADHFANRVDIANLDGDPAGGLDALALDVWDSPEISGDIAVGPLLATGQTTLPALRVAPRPGLAMGWGTRGAALADIDGNGLTDIVIGAPNAPDVGCKSVGITYVFFALGTPATGTTGWAPHSIQPPTVDVDFGAFGWSTATADGSRLVLIGETGRDIEGVAAGQVYVYRVIP